MDCLACMSSPIILGRRVGGTRTVSEYRNQWEDPTEALFNPHKLSPYSSSVLQGDFGTIGD